MKYKSIHTDKNGINWDTYTNQEDEVIWQDSIESLVIGLMIDK